MGRRKTHEEFVQQVYELVGDEYEVVGEYEGARTKITIKHTICGKKYDVVPHSFLAGNRCPQCLRAIGVKKRTKTTDEFKKEVYELVGKEYEVVGEYKKRTEPIILLHKKCGKEWKVQPYNFLNGNRCSHCFGKYQRTKEEFENEIFELVGNEYKLVGKYTNVLTKIKLFHKTCNKTYEVRPASFLFGHRCNHCFGKHSKNSKEFKKEVFDLVGKEYEVVSEYKGANNEIKLKHIECDTIYIGTPSKFINGRRCPSCFGRFVKLHDDFVKEIDELTKGGYKVISQYVNNRSKVKLKHSKCNSTFKMIPSNFLKGYRCPICKASKGETKIAEWLQNNKIQYEQGFSINECRNVNPLPFDFAVFSEDNMLTLIEYNGIQHYENVGFFNAGNGLKGVQKRDKIKKDYCEQNNIPLITIPYWEFDNIETILEEKLLPLDLQTKTDQYEQLEFSL